MAGLKSSSDARPLCWWSEAQLREIQRRLQPAWRCWAEGWCATPSAGELRCELSWEGADRNWIWQVLGRRGAAQAWLAAPTDLPRALWELMFAAEPAGQRRGSSGPVAQQVLAKALGELQEGLRVALALDAPADVGAPGTDCFEPWSGGVIAVLGGETAVTLLLNMECAASLAAMARPAAQAARPRSALVPAQIACADQNILVRAVLSDCELDLGTLASLHVGDVVPLPHPLEVPLEVSADGEPVCIGFLGRVGFSKAIELARPVPHTAAVAADPS